MDGVIVHLSQTPANSFPVFGSINLYSYNEPGRKVVIKVETNPYGIKGFTRCEHYSEGGHCIERIIGLKGNYSGFQDKVDGIFSVSIYYWSSDSQFHNPLVIQLDHDTNKCYSNEGRGKWVYNALTGGTSDIVELLDKENCRWNKAHVLDFSEHKSPSYKCFVCKSDVFSITMTDYKNEYLTTCYISISAQNSVSKFREGSVDQSGLPPLKNIDKIYVFSFLSLYKSPLVVYFFTQGRHSWYYRYQGDPKWTEKGLSKGPTEMGFVKSSLEKYSIPDMDVDVYKGEAKYRGTGTILYLELKEVYVGTKIHKRSFMVKGLYGGFNLKDLCHAGEKLNGISSKKSLIGFSVYYSDLDKGECFPLAISLCEKDEVCEYFKREDYSTPCEKWVKCTKVTNENQLCDEIKVLCENLKNFAIIQTNVDDEGYPFNVDYSTADDLEIAVSTYNQDENKVYDKFTHHMKNGTLLNILTTKHNGNYIKFKSHFLPIKCMEASVYFWSRDKGHKNPLILELKSSQSSISPYFVYDKDCWKNVKLISGGVRGILDKQNCLVNHAHIVDISEKITGSYPCPSGCNKGFINVITSDFRGYSVSKHYSSSGLLSITQTRYDYKDQIGLPTLLGVECIYVFHYPEGTANASLLYIPSGKGSWYKRKSGDVWELEPDLDHRFVNYPAKILYKLQELSRTLAHKSESVGPRASSESTSENASITMAAVIGVMVGCFIGLEIMTMIKTPRSSFVVKIIDNIRGYRW
ncbi:hypothetical protein BEWA_028730 [Theileria equi strain WA]|uniref:Uncharacterized protein n=1 Tax=Theileria equi strain WA TaxID=1537102 RepID=L0AXP8_THEEQ|nr:hypothetical protein BEWA_028730 [Theileria equi strain WA]AFZ80023.1 hypothetical protein BEWA_028730 [Theileria equi strain WA]|eukprot:XP_004829689.1 hypothetical protein BEWA_028730 [Theileria equi strain WA]